jgi:hypothetical protein
MTPGRSASGGANQSVDLPDLRSLGVYQPVILVADDEALIRNLVTLLLQHDGYFVLSAADGHEGLELSRKYPGPIDLVITDVQNAQAEWHRPVRASDPRATRNQGVGNVRCGHERDRQPKCQHAVPA